MPLKLLMMGTGDFGVPTFRALCRSAHRVVGLVTQPDRGRASRRKPRNALKELAEAEGIPVFQPERINSPEAVEQLRRFDADLYVVAAYGQILSPQVIDLPRLGVINVHASLLPKYRGAAPVQYAILNGDQETGVTIFQIQPELDAGPILLAQKTPIGPKETAGELERRLAELAAPLVLQAVEGLEAGTIQPVPQDPSQVTRAPRLKKEHGRIDWSRPAEQIERHVRAMQPWPKAFSFLQRQGQTERLRVAILEAEPLPQAEVDRLQGQTAAPDAAEPQPASAASRAGDSSAPHVPAEASTGDQEKTPGVVVVATRKRLVVQTGRGGLEILRLQPEAGREMTVREFLAGHPVSQGDRFVGDEDGS